LEIILKRDDLNLDEIEVWNNLIKWGLAQDKTLNEDVSKWNQEKFNIFERILHKFIPLVRFCHISSEDNFNKVRPYEGILPKELREEILKFHMVPGYKPILNNLSWRCPSILINQKHVAIIANWIDRKEENLRDIRVIPYKYKFNLILRGSRDGFNPAKFHSKCDNKGASIVVIKIKNSSQIIGGYNPLDWSGCSRNNTPDSFIFCFNDNNINSGKISRSNSLNYYSAVISDPNWGPVFGTYSNNSHDLCMQRDGRWSSYPNFYTDINLPRNFFDIDDYEVFQVSKK
jgi:hypothetical protein